MRRRRWRRRPRWPTAFAGYFYVRIWSAPFSLINYALLGWFYGRAAATTGMMLQMLIHGVDITLSIWFVWGFGWGVEGAALATVIGQSRRRSLGLTWSCGTSAGSRKVLALIVPGGAARCARRCGGCSGSAAT